VAGSVLKSMNPFRKAKKPAAAPVLPEGVRPVDTATLLPAIPHLHPEVERISDRRYGCLLAWPISQPASARRKTWLGRLFAGPARKRRLVLDDLGRRTVELIDGRRNLATIAAELSHETGHEKRATEAAVLAFVGQLVRRNAAALVAPAGEGKTSC
jgi:hypothetical protein